MEAKIPDQHRWLHRLVGEWNYEAESVNDQPLPADHYTSGRESVRLLGENWILAEADGSMPGGGPARMLITLGYDEAQSAFVGTFIGSMMNSMWIYKGALDGNRLVLDTKGPDFSGSGMANYKDTVELLSDDERILSSQVQKPDGSWEPFMRMRYRRVR